MGWSFLLGFFEKKPWTRSRHNLVKISTSAKQNGHSEAPLHFARACRVHNVMVLPVAVLNFVFSPFTCRTIILHCISFISLPGVLLGNPRKMFTVHLCTIKLKNRVSLALAAVGSLLETYSVGDNTPFLGVVHCKVYFTKNLVTT